VPHLGAFGDVRRRLASEQLDSLIKAGERLAQLTCRIWLSSSYAMPLSASQLGLWKLSQSALRLVPK
jgi:hypothetical protein